MVNIIKSQVQIQSLKVSQADNQSEAQQGDTINILGIAGSMRQQSYSTSYFKNGFGRGKKI